MTIRVTGNRNASKMGMSVGSQLPAGSLTVAGDAGDTYMLGLEELSYAMNSIKLGVYVQATANGASLYASLVPKAILSGADGTVEWNLVQDLNIGQIYNVDPAATYKLVFTAPALVYFLGL